MKSKGFEICSAEEILSAAGLSIDPVDFIKDTVEEVILMLESGKPNANKHAINKLKELLR